jgi:hypothetical protein
VLELLPPLGLVPSALNLKKPEFSANLTLAPLAHPQAVALAVYELSVAG